MAGSIVKTFSLHRDHDKALIARLDRLKKGELSPLVRDALNEYLKMRQGVNLADVYQGVQDVKRLLENGVVINNTPAGQTGGDDDAQGAELTADELGGW